MHLKHCVLVRVFRQTLGVLDLGDREHFLHVDVTLVRLVFAAVVIPQLKT